jgi:hypothetical protein
LNAEYGQNRGAHERTPDLLSIRMGLALFSANQDADIKNKSNFAKWTSKKLPISKSWVNIDDIGINIQK